jgi:hypothetical protein
MKIGYWIATVLLCAMLVLGAFMDLSHNPQMVAGIGTLGYPEYFLTIDGTAKCLAILALLIPGFPGVREWAYAGLVFLTIGASWSHLARHQSPAAAIGTLALTAVSYWLWNKTRGTSPSLEKRV